MLLCSAIDTEREFILVESSENNLHFKHLEFLDSTVHPKKKFHTAGNNHALYGWMFSTLVSQGHYWQM